MVECRIAANRPHRFKPVLVERLDFNIDFGAGLLFGETRPADADTEPVVADSSHAV